MGSHVSANIEFQCLEDLLDLPECSISDSDFGPVEYENTENFSYYSENESDSITFSDETLESCPLTCWSKVGCSTFSYNSETGCTVFIGETEKIESSDESFSGTLSPFCETPFLAQFEVTQSFYCEFSTLQTGEDLINEFSIIFDFSVWNFELNYSSKYEISVNAPEGVTVESNRVWLRLSATIIYRTVKTLRRKRSISGTDSFSQGLTDALTINTQAISNLQATEVKG